jgi:peptidoglycan/xylan/chitin deacetylase (PgdA/CDA1 family)
MSRLALKIEIPTYRAALEAAPLLADILRRNYAGASFVFSLGPDRSGRALGQVSSPHLHGRATHASLVSHFGLRSLLYGSLLPSPSVGRRCAEVLRKIRDDGFEVGLHGWDALRWTQEAGQADAAWSEHQLGQAIAAYERIFATPPKLHAAPGWRSNPHGLRLTQRLHFAYASDTRGRYPFVPVWHGEIVRCPQIPTTLPTLDELADAPRPDPQALRESLLDLTAQAAPAGHVFSLRAGPGIVKHPEFVEELLIGWREQGHEVTSIQNLAAGLDMDKLPRHEIVVGRVPGRSGTLLLQGEEFLSAWRRPT